MNTQSLRTIIAINLAVLILIATVLFDVVALSTDRQRFISTKIAEHRLLSLAVAHQLTAKDAAAPFFPPDTEPALGALFQAAEVKAVVVLNPSGGFAHITGMTAPEQVPLVELADRAMQEKKQVTGLYGKTWGVFLPRPRSLLIAGPLMTGTDTVMGSLGTVTDLNDLYAAQRKDQALLFGYALFNLILLTLLGTYIIGRFSVSPINRLVRRAEEYRDVEDLGFFYDRGKNEFRQLSGALNRMLKRIGDDKHRLESSLAGLEKANLEIQNRQNELIRAEKLASVGRLAAGIAHEIGNPVGIVLGYLEMLNDPALSPADRQDYLKRCEAEINRINTTIRELLDFSRPAGEKPCPVALSRVIEETLRMLNVQPGMKDITFSCDFAAANDTVMAPPDRLRQVFVNLVINAADALASVSDQQEGRITITTKNHCPDAGNGPEMVEASVIDNGPGIAAPDLDLVFDPFYTTKEPGKGTGLGLSVCFMIIESLGGTIRIDSNRGQGTVLRIELPAAQKKGSGHETG
ncbi:sensor histidine kinase [Desulfosudis oleivorans]|uniref:histidine kinase n=1 Tax=Desulfosudis oleivorans (strain DSM 6200 / JCM 39069 / Hxd3) TaxID=96561 RepID=A9A0V5_DESOH|nr:sensor histidine kinase [Desulfosudis oleivorans]ABW67580.1 histidine kinase [Desulfosudis oleivorans Hxd3]